MQSDQTRENGTLDVRLYVGALPQLLDQLGKDLLRSQLPRMQEHPSCGTPSSDSLIGPVSSLAVCREHNSPRAFA